MTIETWKQEFYIPVHKVKNDKQAIEQALKKFKGLRPDALKKHAVELSGNCLIGIGEAHSPFGFNFDTYTCGLCRLHHDADRYLGEHICSGCPLYEVGHGCVDAVDSLYDVALDEDKPNPEPMIEVLESL